MAIHYDVVRDELKLKNLRHSMFSKAPRLWNSNLLGVGRRYVSNPPRKSFWLSRSGLAYFWNHKIPVNAKYAAGLVSSAVTIANVHPNILFTVSPPVFVASYFAYRAFVEKQYKKESSYIRPASYEELVDGNHTIDVKPYDESDINNVLHGIENEFDSFKSQVLKLVDARIKDNVVEDDEVFIDQNGQFNYKLGDIENFVVLQLTPEFPETHTLEFIKFGVALQANYSNARKGVVEVYLLEVPEEGSVKKYKMKVMVSVGGKTKHF